LIEAPEHIVTQWFKDEGDAIILLGAPVDTGDPLQGLGGSAYLQVIHGRKTGTPPRCDLEQEKEIHLALRALIYSGAVKSAHDCSEGGLAVALAESCISRQIARDTPRLIGATVDLSPVGRASPRAEDGNGKASLPAPAPPEQLLRREGASLEAERVEAGHGGASVPASQKEDRAEGTTGSSRVAPLRLDALLFGETQGRIVISVPGRDAGKVLAQAKILGVQAARIGTVGGSSLQIKTAQGTLSGDLRELHDLWWNAIARAMSS
jgi:phosphoribosylformylglycinamidine (FGAM) synthase-like enzyme